MKINNKPMSALPSVADTPADTGRSCVRLFGLYTILPKVLRVVVEVLFLYHLITGFYHLEPFLRFGKHVRETASFQQKGPPLTEWPSIIVELRGLPSYVGIPPFSSAFRNVGYLVGYLTGLFLSLPFRPPLRRMPTVRPALSLPPCSFLCGGRGYPRITQDSPC